MALPQVQVSLTPGTFLERSKSRPSAPSSGCLRSRELQVNRHLCKCSKSFSRRGTMDVDVWKGFSGDSKSDTRNIVKRLPHHTQLGNTRVHQHDQDRPGQNNGCQPARAAPDYQNQPMRATGLMSICTKTPHVQPLPASQPVSVSSKTSRVKPTCSRPS